MSSQNPQETQALGPSLGFVMEDKPLELSNCLQDAGYCKSCGKFHIQQWLGHSRYTCNTCLTHEHENQKQRKDQQEAERQRQYAEQQKVRELEIEKAKRDQEESKLKQEKIKAKTNEVQKAQQIEIERIKLQQEEERTKVRKEEIEFEKLKQRDTTMIRKKEIELEQCKEETKREAMAFEVQRIRFEQCEVLAGLDLQQLVLIKELLQLQLDDERNPISGPKEVATTQNRLGATIRLLNNRT